MGKGYSSMCPVKRTICPHFSYAFAEKHANYHATIPVSHLLITSFLQL